MTIRPVTPMDLVNLNIDSLGKTVRGRAIADRVTGEVLAVGGVCHTEPYHAFSVMSPEMKRYPKAIVSFTREFESFMQRYYEVVYAIPDPLEPNSRAILEMAGFRHLYDGPYGPTFKWEKTDRH